MSVNPREEELRRLTVIKSLTRKNINSTNDLKKKELYRKKYEKIDNKLNNLLKEMKLDVN